MEQQRKDLEKELRDEEEAARRERTEVRSGCMVWGVANSGRIV